MNFPCTAQGYWDFYAMRQEAYWWRQAGNPSKTFRDAQLAGGWYPNVIREQDAGTKAYHAGLTPDSSFFDAFWRSMTYRPLNKVKTFQDFGWPNEANALDFLEKVSYAKMYAYVPFTGRHQVSGMVRYIELVSCLRERGRTYADEFAQIDDPRHFFDKMKVFPGFADFFSWQVMCDLMEAKKTKFDENAWVKLGAGASRGLSLAYGGKGISKAGELDHVKRLRDKQRMLPASFKFDGGMTEVTLKNVEHGLCEFSRYIFKAWRC